MARQRQMRTNQRGEALKRFKIVDANGSMLGWIHRFSKEEAEESVTPRVFGKGVRVEFDEEDQH